MEMWKANNPGSRVFNRDIGKVWIPHLTQEVATAFFGDNPDAASLKTSNRLCRELFDSDVLLIICPTYNFGIPSTLKAYLDHVVRSNVTFRYDGKGGYQGLLRHKKAYLIFCMGDRKPDPKVPEPFEIYLQRVLNFIGIEDIETISIHGTADPEFIEGHNAHYNNLLKQLL